MRPAPFQVLAIGLVMAVLAAGCSSGPRRERAPAPVSPLSVDLAPRQCEAFRVEATRITAEPTGNAATIAPGHMVQFSPGSVRERAQYDVRIGPNGGTSGKRWAEIEIVPVGAAPREFLVPVRLRLNYAMCGWSGERRARIMETTTTPHVVLGGADAPAHRFVEVLVEHFTSFAIAH